MAKRSMPPALKAYWANKRRKASGATPRKPRMASKTRRIAASAGQGARKAYGKYRGQRATGFRLSSAGAGAAGRTLSRYIGAWGTPLGTAGVGMMTKNQFATDLGLYQAGAMLADSGAGLLQGILPSGATGNAPVNLQVL